jgi:ribonuclease-3
MNLQEFQEQAGLRFVNDELLQQALTHRSYLNEHEGEALQQNERLEFLGDAVLDFLTADALYHRYPDMPEGELTRLRAALVRTETLAQVAIELRIGEMLRMAKGEESSGGRLRQRILCDAFEAVVGALYLDQGLEAAANLALPRLTPLLENILAEGLHIDARSLFQEWSQAALNTTPQYRVIESSGPEHDKAFTVEVVIAEQVVAQGSGRSKQLAAQAAARAALRRLEQGELQILLPAADEGLAVEETVSPSEEITKM